MSDHRSIAAVTVTLKSVVENSLRALGSSASVTTERPRERGAAQSDARVNIFLYQLRPNPAQRNNYLPARSSQGRLAQISRAALDLHYLFSFYGDEARQEAQQLFGMVASFLHAQPLLDRAAIQQALAAERPGSPLRRCNLGEEPEAIRFTPLPLDLEELSKLWSVFFQTEYALSVAYLCSAIFLDYEEPAPPAPPLVQEVRVQTGLDGPAPPTPEQSGSVIAIQFRYAGSRDSRLRALVDIALAADASAETRAATIVFVRWILPDGNVRHQAESVNAGAQARFEVPRAPGRFQLVVTNIVSAAGDYRFERGRADIGSFVVS